MNKIHFYQNNPCVISRVINDDFVEIMLSHKFAENMKLRGQCQGCCIGDSDNKLTCTCDEHSWIIEEIQEEEHKVICIVERRLLLSDPIEKAPIDKLQNQIKKENESLLSTKKLHDEWSESLRAKQRGVEIAEDELSLINEKIKLASIELSRVTDGLDEKIKVHDKIIVEIGKYSSSYKQVSNVEYKRLLKSQKILDALNAGGVDNWEWYGESLEKMDGDL
jgi:hypothetical protein